MKKWQKISGVIAIAALILAHIIVLLDYCHLAEESGAWCAEFTQESFFDCIYMSKLHFMGYHLLSLVDCIVIVFLFICLWRKGGKR